MTGGNIRWAFFVVLAALLEATWMRGLSVQGVVPDLVLVLVVYFAIAEGEERAMFTGLLGGMFQDVAANTPLGQHVLCLVIVGFVLGRMSQRLVTDNPYIKGAAVFLASLVHGNLFITIDYVQKVDIDAVYTMSFSLLPKAFYTAVTTPVIFFIMGRLRPRLVRNHL